MLLSIPILPVSISPSNGYFLLFRLSLIIGYMVVMLVMPMFTHQVHILFLHSFLLTINMMNNITIDTKIFLSLIANLCFLSKKQSRGHPEAGRMWKIHINSILFSPELNFRTTTHDRCINHTKFEGVKVLLLHQTDDFAISCPTKETANKIYDIIGQKLQLPLEDEPLFEYFGLIKDFNGIDVHQT